MNITEFLEARITEDETYAYHALGLLGMENPWWTWGNLKARFESLSRADAQHIERHGPRRILAECAAKRAVIEQAEEATGLDVSVDNDRLVGRRDMKAEPYCGDVILAALAAVYSDHPDYQQEWAL